MGRSKADVTTVLQEFLLSLLSFRGDRLDSLTLWPKHIMVGRQEK